MILAARGGNIEGCKHLLSMKADVNQKGFKGRTALHHAIICNKIEFLRYLLEGADANANAIDDVSYGRALSVTLETHQW